MNNKYERSHKPNCDNNAIDEIAAEAAVCADATEEAIETRRRRSSEFSGPSCVSTNQIYDSCRDRDCVSNARVYLTAFGQELLESAINVKLKKAEIIWVYSNIEPLSFNNGYFSVDLKFFVHVTLEIFTGVCNPVTVCGLSTYDKRVILFGSEGNSKVFTSNSNIGTSCDLANCWRSTAMPTVVVETVEPVALSAKIVEPKECCECCCDCCECEQPASTVGCGCNIFPESICGCFDEELILSNDSRQIAVSFGLFSIIRLERDSQLLIDAVDFCIPTQECVSATEENPCNLFNDIRFPIDEFYPPQKNNDDNYRPHSCGCGCSN